ncbi:MAG: cytochrome c, partial [Myxococcota bacterium]
AVARGAEIFSDPTVGCADCHTGDRFTDQGRHVVFGSEIDTPSLRGLGASPPYLHDGSAATLRELLESALGGGMGAPRSLSNAELDDLESFLETL